MNSATHTGKCRMGDTAKFDRKVFQLHLNRTKIVTARDVGRAGVPDVTLGGIMPARRGQ